MKFELLKTSWTDLFIFFDEDNKFFKMEPDPEGETRIVEIFDVFRISVTFVSQKMFQPQLNINYYLFQWKRISHKQDTR